MQAAAISKLKGAGRPFLASYSPERKLFRPGKPCSFFGGIEFGNKLLQIQPPEPSPSHRRRSPSLRLFCCRPGLAHSEGGRQGRLKLFGLRVLLATVGAVFLSRPVGIYLAFNPKPTLNSNSLNPKPCGLYGSFFGAGRCRIQLWGSFQGMGYREFKFSLGFGLRGQ